MTNFKPLSKTLVSEIRITVADLYSRTKVAKSSGAAALNTNLINSDITLISTAPYDIPPIKSTLTIICFEPIRLNIIDAIGNISNITINNQFTFNGSCLNRMQLVTNNPIGCRVQLVYC